MTELTARILSISSHLLISCNFTCVELSDTLGFANPVRYVWALSLMFAAIGALSFVYAVVLYFQNEVSAFVALTSLSMLLIGLILFIMGAALRQGNMVQRELWILQQNQRRIMNPTFTRASDRKSGEPKVDSEGFHGDNTSGVE